MYPDNTLHNSTESSAVSSDSDAGKVNDLLTDREFEVLRSYAHGASREVVAGELNISQNTVGTHLTHIYEKLGMHKRYEVSLWFFKNYKGHPRIHVTGSDRVAA